MERILDMFPVESPTKPDSEQIYNLIRGSASPIGSKLGTKNINVACWPCRRRKGKCGGERPCCSSCKKRGVECGYEFDESQSRTASLKAELGKYKTRTATLEVVLEQLRSRSDDESSLLLALIRLNVDVDEIAVHLSETPELLVLKVEDGSTLPAHFLVQMLR